MSTALLPTRARPRKGEPLRPAVLNPGRMLQEMAASFRPAATSKGLEFRLELCTDWHDVVIDGFLVKQVIGDLLRSAIERTSAGWVRLAVTPPDGEHWNIIIEDSGHRIAPEQNGSLFQPSDGASSAPVSELAASKQLVDRLHGTISSSGDLRQGSRVQVRLPVMVWD